MILFDNIKVRDQDCQLVEIIEQDYNAANVNKAIRKYEASMGKAVKVDSGSDCDTLVFFEKGVMAFSI